MCLWCFVILDTILAIFSFLCVYNLKFSGYALEACHIHVQVEATTYYELVQVISHCLSCQLPRVMLKKLEAVSLLQVEAMC